MGADGHVTLYDAEEARAKHRELHKRELEDDWTYLGGIDTGWGLNCRVELDSKEWLVRYWESGTAAERDSVEEVWCASEEAAKRVEQTLDSLGGTATDSCEVWT